MIGYNFRLYVIIIFLDVWAFRCSHVQVCMYKFTLYYYFYILVLCRHVTVSYSRVHASQDVIIYHLIFCSKALNPTGEAKKPQFLIFFVHTGLSGNILGYVGYYAFLRFVCSRLLVSLSSILLVVRLLICIILLEVMIR